MAKSWLVVATAALLAAQGLAAPLLPFTFDRGVVANNDNTGRLSDGVAGKAGWREARATFFGGPDSFTNFFLSRGKGAFGDALYGSCGYFETREGAPELDVQDLPFGQVAVAAVANLDPDYPGSCGRCYEIRCRPGIQFANGSSPQLFDNSLTNPNYLDHLAAVRAKVKDSYGREYPGNALEPINQESVVCWNSSTGAVQDGSASSSTVVRITDSCPAFQNKTGGINQQGACNSDIYQFDLSYYAFEQLAHPLYSGMGVQFRPVDCYTQLPFTGFSNANGQAGNSTGIDFTTYDNRTSEFKNTREGADVPYLVNMAGFLPGYINNTIYSDRVETGWGWSPFYLHSSEFWRQVPGYQPFGATSQLQFWDKTQDSPNGTYYHFVIPLSAFKCDESPLKGTAGVDTINFISESNQDYGSFCLDDIKLV
ncbi:hypothetical protein WJX72_006675 [[Myrmecia] bisecta]|uniref:Expansin-like EG45 domain-containing protein n=1 Tax=[Myrmecia] bisecta TaxID=41462 RepID=A0AAW1PD22_9CHLO